MSRARYALGVTILGVGAFALLGGLAVASVCVGVATLLDPEAGQLVL